LSRAEAIAGNKRVKTEAGSVPGAQHASSDARRWGSHLRLAQSKAAEMERNTGGKDEGR
jgi:hypothetical protein